MRSSRFLGFMLLFAQSAGLHSGLGGVESRFRHPGDRLPPGALCRPFPHRPAAGGPFATARAAARRAGDPHRPSLGKRVQLRLQGLSGGRPLPPHLPGPDHPAVGAEIPPRHQLRPEPGRHPLGEAEPGAGGGGRQPEEQRDHAGAPGPLRGQPARRAGQPAHQGHQLPVPRPARLEERASPGWQEVRGPFPVRVHRRVGLPEGSGRSGLHHHTPQRLRRHSIHLLVRIRGEVSFSTSDS